MTYRPPFVSERLNEVVFNGCTFRSAMMQWASWTEGEALLYGNGNPMTPAAIHKLAEDLEPGPPTQSRGFNPLDFNQAIHARWPDLPEIPSWDNSRARLRIDFPEFRRRIIAGEVAVLQGNAVQVKDQSSPLHKFVGDVGHAIAIVEGGPDAGFVMDPMGLPVDTYDGSWTPWKDIEEFASEYSRPNGFVFGSLVVRGAQGLASLNSQITSLTKNLNRCTTARTAAETKAAAALKQASDLKAIVTDLNKLVDDLKKQIAAGAPPETFTPGTLCDVRDGADIFDKPDGPLLGTITPPLTRFQISTTVSGGLTRISSILDGNPRTVWIATGDVDNVHAIPIELNCDIAVAAAVEPLQDKIAAALAALAA